MFEIGKEYETLDGRKIKVLGRTELKGYETLICSDNKHRYDRSNQSDDAGRCTGTSFDYTYRHNFKRADKPNQCYYNDSGMLISSDGTRSILDGVDQ